MIEQDKKLTEDIIKTAQLLAEKINVLCKRGACMWCPLDNIEDCNNYIQISKMEYYKELDHFH